MNIWLTTCKCIVALLEQLTHFRKKTWNKKCLCSIITSFIENPSGLLQQLVFNCFSKVQNNMRTIWHSNFDITVFQKFILQVDKLFLESVLLVLMYIRVIIYAIAESSGTETLCGWMTCIEKTKKFEFEFTYSSKC